MDRKIRAPHGKKREGVWKKAGMIFCIIVCFLMSLGAEGKGVVKSGEMTGEMGGSDSAGRNRMEVLEEDLRQQPSGIETGKEDWQEEKDRKEEEGREEEQEKENQEEENQEEAKEREKELVVEVSLPDGKGGYYRTLPEVRISRQTREGTIRYRLIREDKTEKEGEIPEGGEGALTEMKFPQQEWEEGRQTLILWREDKESTEKEGTDEEGNSKETGRWEREFLIDTVPPQIRLLPQPELYGWRKEPFAFTAYSRDTGSGVETTICFENGKETKRGREEVKGMVTGESVEGLPIQILIRAEDLAGNIQEKGIEAYVDKKPPTITIEGGEDYTITSKALELTCTITEENRLEEAGGVLEREEGKEQKEKVEIGGWEKNKKDAKTCVRLEKDGKYQIRLWGEDLAGHQAKKELHVILDSQNPVIRYVDQLNGSCRKTFVWEYPMEDTIEDMTSVQYVMELDKRVYAAGEEVTEEGRHRLTVTAVDAAGNTGRAQAEFMIDHTPPVVIWEGANEEGIYEKAVNLKIRTEKMADRIRRVWINGELQKRKGKKEREDLRFQDPGTYKVTVEAEDTAGNTSVQTRSFSVVQRAGWLKRTIRSLKYSKGEEVWQENKNSNRKTGKPVKRKWNKIVWTAGICTLVWGIWGTVLYKKRKKPAHKREDAG